MRYRIGRWLQGIVFVTLAPGAAWGQPVSVTRSRNSKRS